MSQLIEVLTCEQLVRALRNNGKTVPDDYIVGRDFHGYEKQYALYRCLMQQGNGLLGHDYVYVWLDTKTGVFKAT